MAFDIYGNHLRPGYCEVHPDVKEEYPCRLCMEEYEHNYYLEQERYEYETAMKYQYVRDMLPGLKYNCAYAKRR